VDCAALDFGIMPPASRLDDPSALADFLSSISAPDTLAAAVKSAGFHTLGSLASALTDPSDPDEVMQFIRVILKIPDGDATATFRPDVSCLRRTILEACSIAPPRAASANAPSQLPPAAPSASSSNKITAAEFLSLRKDYLKKYPGELLTPANTPSVEFLSLIRQHHESGQSVWIPWRQRTSEADFLHWEESRRPRSDRQMLRSLLDLPDEAAGPTFGFSLNGPSESVLRRCLDLFAIALALLDLVHLATIKRFNDKFFTMATTPPSDTTLRAPVLQEVVHADRAVWMTVSALVRDQAWSLTDSLNEVGFCRHDMAPLLQPRPKPARSPQLPSGPTSAGKPNPRKRTNPDGPGRAAPCASLRCRCGRAQGRT
ncbi:slc47a1, partial [Symbiodinium necroappetens]